jgi:hypothetical protein
VGIAPRADAVLFRVNTTPVTYGEYLRYLQRQQVNVSGAPAPIAASRFVIDQLVGQAILVEEATRAGVMPSEAQVDGYYRVQKTLYEQQFPGRAYEKTLTDQGSLPDDMKAEMRSQLAEAALFATQLKITEADVRGVYDAQKTQLGLPERVQMRLIVVAPDSPDVEAVTKALAAKTPFEQVARQYNPPQLRSAAGLLAQTTPISQVNSSMAEQVKTLPEGSVFGPMDFQQRPDTPKLKAWARIEKKLPPVTLSYDEAWFIVLRGIVQQKIAQPENAAIRAAIVRKKLEAIFESKDPVYQSIWQSIRQGAMDAGIGRP